jgi:hypothetical protein
VKEEAFRIQKIPSKNKLEMQELKQIFTFHGGGETESNILCLYQWTSYGHALCRYKLNYCSRQVTIFADA